MKLATWILAPVTIVGLALAGCAGSGTETAGTGEEAASAPEGPARYEIAVGTDGFTPATVRARKGQPVTLVFTRTAEETCGTEVVFAGFEIEKELPLNEPVEVTLVPDRTGEIKFNCGMDMLHGKIVVN